MVDSYVGHSVVMTEPLFLEQAESIVKDLNTYTIDELQKVLRVNRKIASQNYIRYHDFFIADKAIPAMFAYTGTAYRELSARTMPLETADYANDHLLIGSFLYGLLRPSDGIHPYRLEGKVALSVSGFYPLFDYWKPILTDRFIEEIKSDDGVLVNLASQEFTQLMDWKKVCRELTVITPEFKVDKGDGKLETVIVYAKMCRGAMTRWILENRISTVEELKAFEFQGFHQENNFLFVN